jgi:HEAT repeat protein
MTVPLPSTGQAEDANRETVDSLFVLASTGVTKYGHLVESAREALVEMGTTAAPYLAEKLDTKDARERHTLRDLLERIGEPSVEPLIAALSDTTKRVRSLAADILGRVGDKRALAPVTDLLSDTARSVRAAACESLGRIGDGSSTAPLVGALSDTSESVRKSAAFALGLIADADAFDPLVAALGDPFFGVRYAAAGALGKMPSRCITALRGVVNDRSRTGGVRALALLSLSECDERGWHGTSEAMLFDESREVRATAIRLLVSDERATHRRVLEQALESECDPMLRAMIETALLDHE